MPDTGPFSAYCAGVAMNSPFERLARFGAIGADVAEKSGCRACLPNVTRDACRVSIGSPAPPLITIIGEKCMQLDRRGGARSDFRPPRGPHRAGRGRGELHAQAR